MIGNVLYFLLQNDNALAKPHTQNLKNISTRVAYLVNFFKKQFSQLKSSLLQMMAMNRLLTNILHVMVNIRSQ